MLKGEVISKICAAGLPDSSLVQVELPGLPGITIAEVGPRNPSSLAAVQAKLVEEFLTHQTPEIPDGVDLSKEQFGLLRTKVQRLRAETDDRILFEEAREANSSHLQAVLRRLDELSEGVAKR